MRGLKELEDEIRKIRRESEVYIISPADVEHCKKCVGLQEKVREILLRIESDQLVKAMELLKYLQPFARKRAIVELKRESGCSEILIVGHSIYTTWTCHQNLDEYKGRRVVGIRDMFNTIFKYKDKIVPLLRRSIKDDFLEIVELVEGIRKSLEMEISRKGSFRIWEREGVKIKPRYADKIFMLGKQRFYRICYSFGSKYFTCDLIDRLEKFFEVYEVVYDILAEAHQILMEEFRKNEERLRRIKDIVAPYILAKEV
ncbi:hypothetical protein DRP04_13070 [Archaeoglobales archaeon]|nr:MAG: hypothetical protein DRP04_13070 [Archaeoglobales archaeon]